MPSGDFFKYAKKDKRRFEILSIHGMLWTNTCAIFFGHCGIQNKYIINPAISNLLKFHEMTHRSPKISQKASPHFKYN